MAGVFQHIDPPSPHHPASGYPSPLVRGEDTLAGWREGWGVNILKDVRHSSVLYVCKYFVAYNKKAKKLKNKLIPLTFTVLILTKANQSQTSHFQADLLWCEG
jgi:hypothetical protein